MDFILKVMGSYGRFLSRGKGEIGFTFSWVIKDVGKVKSECIAQLLGVKLGWVEKGPLGCRGSTNGYLV